MFDYDYIIEHRSGSRMPRVDFLSRYPVFMIIQSELLVHLAAAREKYQELRSIVPDGEKYILSDRLLYEVQDGKNLLMIPKGMQTEIIRNAHDIGHFGIAKNEALIRRDYSMTDLKDKIQIIINQVLFKIRIFIPFVIVFFSYTILFIKKNVI